MDPATISTSTFTLRDASNALVAGVGAVQRGHAHRDAHADAARSFRRRPTRRSVIGGPGGVADLAGNPMSADVVWSFTTAAPPADDGPGGPILVIGSSANPFGRYYGEILRAEGLNEYRGTDIANVTPAVLSSYHVVILGDMTLTAAQATMLSNWVTAGGKLVAMRPDSQLAGLLGLTRVAGSVSNAYLHVDTSQPPGQGITDQTIQYHGTADQYQLSGASSVATLYSDATTATVYPAVTLHAVGTSGGQASAFTYDLARSVVYTRQGNPAWSGQERDGQPPIRSDDLFFGAVGDRSAARLGQPRQGRDPAGRRATASARQPGAADGEQPHAAAAVLVPAAGRQGRRRDDRRRPRQRRHRRPLRRADRRQPARLQRRELGVRAQHVVRVPGHAADRRAGRGVHEPRLRGRAARHAPTAPTGRRSRSRTSTATSSRNGTPSTRASPGPSPIARTASSNSDYSTQPHVELANGIRLDTNYYYWPPDVDAGPARACSPARGSRCGSPIPTAPRSTCTRPRRR